ncbi:MAG: class I SAM-dependent methyltransferase [Candidatus Woesearchaeota archaeon]
MKNINFKNYINEFKKRNYVGNLYGKEISIISKSDLCIFDHNYKFIKKIISKDSKILEIGPGNGHFIDWLLLNGYKNITCVDLDEDNIIRLKNKYSKINSIRCYSEDAISFLSKTKEKFDLIISRQVIEHLFYDQIFKYFENSAKCLSSNGFLITETINSSNLIMGNYMRYSDFSHHYSFTPRSIAQFSEPYFVNEFRNYYFPSLFKIIFYYFSKKINNQYSLFLNYLKLKNNQLDDRRILSLKNFLKKIKIAIEYVSYSYYWNYESVKFSSKYLPNEKILTPFFIAISKLKK